MGALPSRRPHERVAEAARNSAGAGSDRWLSPPQPSRAPAGCGVLDPDVERPRFTFKESMAGFDMDELMEWAGLRAAEARGAMGGGAGGVGAAEGGEVATPARADEATATAAPPADARAANEADGAVPAGAT